MGEQRAQEANTRAKLLNMRSQPFTNTTGLVQQLELKQFLHLKQHIVTGDYKQVRWFPLVAYNQKVGTKVLNLPPEMQD